LKEAFMCAPSFLVCARLMTCVHTHTRAQLRGNIGWDTRWRLWSESLVY